MRRGRTVQIKMSSATAWIVSMSASKLFHALVAAAAKVPSPKQLEVRWADSVLVSAERSCLARASVTSWQLSARYPGARSDKDRWTSVAILNTTHCRTGKQCSWRSTGEIWSVLLAPVTNMATEGAEPAPPRPPPLGNRLTLSVTVMLANAKFLIVLL